MQTLSAPPGGGLGRFRRRYGAVLEVVVMALVIGLALEVTLGIVFRAIGKSLTWYDEVASVMLAWLTFYGSALASVKRAHISCPEVVEQAPPRARRAIAVVAQLLVIAFFALLGWIGASILPIIASETLVSVPVSMAVVQSVIPVSCVLILIAEALHLVVLLRPAEAPGPSGPALSDGLH
jgi:TRAP-type C4-dicarboxylate transport system permease small subunit